MKKVFLEAEHVCASANTIEQSKPCTLTKNNTKASNGGAIKTQSVFLT